MSLWRKPPVVRGKLVRWTLVCVSVFVALHVLIGVSGKQTAHVYWLYRSYLYGFDRGTTEQARWTTNSTQLLPTNPIYQAKHTSGRLYNLKTLSGNHIPFRVDYLHSPSLENTRASTLLVYVQSRSRNFDKRDLIRTTWGDPGWYSHLTDFSIKVIFVCGLDVDDVPYTEHENKSSKLEIQHHRDMLIANFSDTYDNLTFKGIAAMDWIDLNVPNVKFILKTDDDIFVNVFGWYHIIKRMESQHVESYIAGFVWRETLVRRSKGKNPLSTDEYRHKYKPRFCSGSGYLMTRKSVSELLLGMPQVPIIKKDDLYFTGLLSFHTKTVLFRLELKYFHGVLHAYDPRILFSGKILIAHGLNESFWSDLQRTLSGMRRSRGLRTIPRLIEAKDRFLHQQEIT